MIAHAKTSSVGLLPGYDPTATAGNCYFDDAAASHAIEFFATQLQYIEGETAGDYFVLEPWQKAIVAALFGWKRPDGLRRYREAFIFVPRKNGKTPMVAGIVDYVGFCEGEPGAQLYSAAADREQASLIYRHASGMIARNPDLEKNSVSYRTTKSIEYYGGDAFYKSLSSDVAGKHGQNIHLVVVDELHALPNRDLVDTLTTATGTRRQPLIIYITTAGFDKNSICYEKYDYACKVRDGIIEDASFLPVIYEALPEDDWKDPEVWARTNPNLGVSIRPDFLARECRKAQEMPAYENTFRRLYLNQWTEQETRWLAMDTWDACHGTMAASELLGRLCFGGLDVSSKKDLTCWGLLFPIEEYWVWMPRFYIPKDMAHQRENGDRVPYSQWTKEGYVMMTEGNTINYDFLMADIARDCEQYDMRLMGFDRFGFEAIRQQLQKVGIPEDRMISFGQGYFSMSEPMKRMESLILGGKLIHNQNPVMRWMANNVVAEIDPAENIKPNKAKSRTRIDGIVALIMALGVAITQPEDLPSVYETRGFLTA